MRIVIVGSPAMSPRSSQHDDEQPAARQSGMSQRSTRCVINNTDSEAAGVAAPRRQLGGQWGRASGVPVQALASRSGFLHGILKVSGVSEL
jgi:hypothetical protein